MQKKIVAILITTLLTAADAVNEVKINSRHANINAVFFILIFRLFKGSM